MRRHPKRSAATRLALAGLALLGAALAEPADAGAQTRSRRPARSRDRDITVFSPGWGLLDDYNWTILRMQRESIASQEERAREAGRERRRAEVEAEQEAEAAAREEYFDAVIEASRAALRAPRGAYYRKPGFLSTEPPGAAARALEVGGIRYLYEQGIFWLPQGEQYVVVTAPLGAVVDAPPPGSYPVASADGVLHYFFGTFFREDGGKFAVVRPPAGVVVSYVPDGYVQETANGKTVYRFGPVAFRPVFVQGVLAYQVLAP